MDAGLKRKTLGFLLIQRRSRTIFSTFSSQVSI